MMEENEEEENDDNYTMFPEYGDTTMEDLWRVWFLDTTHQI